MRSGSFISEKAKKFASEYGIFREKDLESILGELNVGLYAACDMPEEISGITIKSGKKRYVFIINQQQDRFERITSIVCQIAHIILGHCRNRIVITSDIKNSKSQQDKEAYRFALELFNNALSTSTVEIGRFMSIPQHPKVRGEGKPVKETARNKPRLKNHRQKAIYIGEISESSH